MQQPSFERDIAAIDTTGHLILGLNSEFGGRIWRERIEIDWTGLRDIQYLPVLRTLALSVPFANASAPIPSQDQSSWNLMELQSQVVWWHVNSKGDSLCHGPDTAWGGEGKACCKQISSGSQQRSDNSQQTVESLSHMGNPGVGVCWVGDMSMIN